VFIKIYIHFITNQLVEFPLVKLNSQDLRSRKVFFGLFSFRWKHNWAESFKSLRGNGRIFVAPILQTLILNRDPQTIIAWADKVASWNFAELIMLIVVIWAWFNLLPQYLPQWE